MSGKLHFYKNLNTTIRRVRDIHMHADSKVFMPNNQQLSREGPIRACSSAVSMLSGYQIWNDPTKACRKYLHAS